MIMPMPFYVKANRFEFGTVDVLVEDDAAKGAIGFSSGSYGSISNNTLIMVDGSPLSVTTLWSDGSLNRFIAIADSNDDAVAIVSELQAQFTNLRDSATTWAGATADFTVELTTWVYYLNSGAANNFTAADDGLTYTMGWY